MWLNEVDRDTYNRWLQELQGALPELEIEVSYYKEKLVTVEVGYYWDGHWQPVQHERFPLTPKAKRFVNTYAHAIAMARAAKRFE